MWTGYSTRGRSAGRRSARIRNKYGDALEIATIVLVGWIAGAELGSWCCVQPVVARLPYEHDVAIERAMLRTFGRVMLLVAAAVVPR
ncbi:MAG: hypothetical protein ACRD2J_08590 [Thermoanaerobaculia bacterium]